MTLEHYARSVLASLLEPLRALVEPDSRVYLPYLVGSALIASGLWLVRFRRRTSLLTFLFPPRLWLHRSALFDYRLMFARAVVRAALLGPFSLSVLGVALAVSTCLRSLFGEGPGAEVDRGVVVALFSVSAFVAQDLARFVVHRAAHAVPALWELHKVHHSAEVLTPFTVYRVHPLESLLMRSGAGLVVGVLGGGFSWCFPGAVSGLTILGVDALAFVWTMLGSNLRHSHVWLSYGRILEHVFISPAQHQRHHSDQPQHHHTNFGSTFAVWDWLFGSLAVTGAREQLSFGLPAALKNHDASIASALIDPVLSSVRRLTKPTHAPLPQSGQ